MSGVHALASQLFPFTPGAVTRTVSGGAGVGYELIWALRNDFALNTEFFTRISGSQVLLASGPKWTPYENSTTLSHIRSQILIRRRDVLLTNVSHQQLTNSGIWYSITASSGPATIYNINSVGFAQLVFDVDFALGYSTDVVLTERVDFSYTRTS